MCPVGVAVADILIRQPQPADVGLSVASTMLAISLSNLVLDAAFHQANHDPVSGCRTGRGCATCLASGRSAVTVVSA